MEMKLGNIPSWDGDPDTAITYFAGLQEIATMGGYIYALSGCLLGRLAFQGEVVGSELVPGP